MITFSQFAGAIGCAIYFLIAYKMFTFPAHTDEIKSETQEMGILSLAAGIVGIVFFFVIV